jgi:hypothetical protein
MGGIKIMKKAVLLILLVVMAGFSIVILRGPYISNILKKALLPEIGAASGHRVVAQRISVNLFPLFVDAREIEVFDTGGKKLIVVPRTKAYIDLIGLLQKHIIVRRLVMKEPVIETERRQIDEILENIRAYSGKESSPGVRVDIGALEIQKGTVHFVDPETYVMAEIRGLEGEITLGKVKRVKVRAREVEIRKKGWPDMAGNVSLDFDIRNDVIDITKFVIGSAESVVENTGEIRRDKSVLDTNVELLVSTVKKMFGLKRSGAGKILVKGDLHYTRGELITDLSLSGNFHIETLMELLRVKEKVEGIVDVEGNLKGPLNALEGKGTVFLRDGNLFNVRVDSMRCDISYADGRMDFSDGAGRIYDGYAAVSASIRLPVVNFFDLKVDFSGVDSLPLFGLIGWDPGIQKGKVNGFLTSSGARFNPKGHFEYASTEKGEDVLGRVKSLSGEFDKEGAIIRLTGLKIGTGKTEVTADGSVDIHRRELNFQGTVLSEDVADVTAPYYRDLKGRGTSRLSITGPLDNPHIRGTVNIFDPVLKNYNGALLNADVSYEKKELIIPELTVKSSSESFTLKGNIFFPSAERLFDLSHPEFKLNASVRGADLGRFVRIFYPEFRGRGATDGDIRISGKGEDLVIAGSSSLGEGSVFGVAFDSASFRWSHHNGKFDFTGMDISRGKSHVYAEGASLDDKGNFTYKARSGKILLSDLVPGHDMPGDAVLEMSSEGHGTVENPEIVVTGKVIEVILKEKTVGSGTFRATMKGRDIAVSGNMTDDKLFLSGMGRLEGDRPWEAKIEIRGGRYDRIVGAFMKDAPDDLILSMSGSVFMRGDRQHIFASSIIDRLTLSMYGYSFTNENMIKLILNDRRLMFDKISMRSGDTSLVIDGGLTLGKRYDLVLEGSSALSPFRSISERIGLLKGDAEMVLSVTGDWESPHINGGVNLSNGSFGFKEYNNRISSLTGYLYMDNDRIVLENLSGKLSGGDVTLSGIVYLKKFSIKRFYLEGDFRNVSASPSSDFNVNFDGSMLFKGDPEAQTVSGDIRINRARYKERVDWKSWLLKTKKSEKYNVGISSLEKVELNIRINGKDNIRIDNNVARATVSADMILRGTLHRPLLLGRLESTEGTVYFRNNDFRIVHASADFAETSDLNPFIQISSETDVKGYTIRMNLEGQLDHFDLALSSEPALKEIDILSLLTVGKTGGDVKGLEGGIGASEATSFVTGKLQDVIEERMSSITGLDRFQIDPYVSKTTGTIEPRLTVSKRLLGDKMALTYASAVGSTEEQIIKLEYFVSKNASLVGIRDERGLVGGDIRFRFEFK